MTSSRTLSVILAADAVGYSRLSEKDEAAAIAAVTWFRERAAEIVTAHDGRIFFRAGDGVMAEFAGARAGVLAALELAETVRARVAHGDRPALPVRIGLHLGDVAVETDGDRLGHDVNVAARIQQSAEPGEVLMSRALADVARGKVDARFEKVGAERLKNLSEPVEAFRVVAGSTLRRGLLIPLVAAAAIAAAVAVGTISLLLTQTAPTEPTTTAAAEIAAGPSIAVLPFVNMSSDPEQEYFSDGLSEELLNQLVQIDDLRVIARTSSFAFKNQNVDMREVGRALGVSHLLEGSVRKSGGTVRIVAQLIDASDGSHIWSKTYDRELLDVFAVQEEIAGTVAEELSLSLNIAATVADFGGTASLEAYDHYLRGRAFSTQFNPDDLQRALDEFQLAVAIDPSYGLAWAGIADASLLLGSVFLTERATELAAVSEDAVARGLAAAPDVWQLQVQKARQLWTRRDWEGADRTWAEIKRLAPPAAVELNFNYGGFFLAQVGREMEASQAFVAARAADPLSAATSAGVAWGLQLGGDFDAASREYERCQTLPGCSGAAAYYALVLLLHVGDHAGAAALLADYPTDIPSERSFMERFAQVWEAPEDARALLRTILDDPSTSTRPATFSVLAAHYGDTELALAMMRKSLDAGHPFTVWLWMPQMAEVRRTPEFKQLVRDLGLYDYFRESGEWNDFCRPLGDDDFECF